MWKYDSNDLILIIIKRVTKMVHYELVKIMIDVPGLAEVIIDIVMRYHRVSASIVMDQDLLFILKF